MSFLKVRRPSGNKRGRPRGSGFLKKPEQKSTKQTRLSQELWDLVETERGKNETMSETILRLIRVARQNYIAARKKADALEERLTLVKSQYIYAKGP